MGDSRRCWLGGSGEGARPRVVSVGVCPWASSVASTPALWSETPRSPRGHSLAAARCSLLQLLADELPESPCVSVTVSGALRKAAGV